MPLAPGLTHFCPPPKYSFSTHGSFWKVVPNGVNMNKIHSVRFLEKYYFWYIWVKKWLLLRSSQKSVQKSNISVNCQPICYKFRRIEEYHLENIYAKYYRHNPCRSWDTINFQKHIILNAENSWVVKYCSKWERFQQRKNINTVENQIKATW